ncbi:hypothetical protein BBJ28_00015160 [Nothophytophthora sp. Chile5]|nr:hypothetical protein BBJ28_00015160 [Nothophytophthora sp. Chile5]
MAAAPRGSYTPAQMQALYLSRGRPDMAFMSNQAQLPIEMPEMQQTCTVKNHVNLKKASLKLEHSAAEPNQYALTFQFDATKPCRISVFLVAAEAIDSETGSSSFKLVHEDKTPVLRREFPQGLNQSFGLHEEAPLQDDDGQQPRQRQTSLLGFSAFDASELSYKPGSADFPLIIVLEVSDSR